MKQTIVKVCDNSGAKYAMCIGLYRNRVKAQIGDTILVSIKKMYKGVRGTNVQAGKVYKAIVMRTKKHFSKSFHHYRFLENAVALIDHQGNPIGNRIRGSTLRLEQERSVQHKKLINITEKAF